MTELDNERAAFSSQDRDGAVNSVLKLPVAGRRDDSDGSLHNVGSYGTYWSSTVGGSKASLLYFNSSNAYIFSDQRANGFSVRCIKE
jgi:uncharacterized protein (TIGR02145 family)